MRSTAYQGEDQESMGETEFSRPSISKRRCAGYEDMKHALGAAPWTKSIESFGATVHRCANGQIVSSVTTAK